MIEAVLHVVGHLTASLTFSARCWNFSVWKQWERQGVYRDSRGSCVHAVMKYVSYLESEWPEDS